MNVYEKVRENMTVFGKEEGLRGRKCI